MTDNEIIKALECCSDSNCHECPIEGCTDDIFGNALDLINRQKAGIERLSIESETLVTQLKVAYEQIHKLNMAKFEAIKEFAEKLKNCFVISGDYLDIINIIDNLVKEMTE